MTAKIYTLVAKMEGLIAEIEALKREWPQGGEHFFREKADQLNDISNEFANLREALK